MKTTLLFLAGGIALLGGGLAAALGVFGKKKFVFLKEKKSLKKLLLSCSSFYKNILVHTISQTT